MLTLIAVTVIIAKIVTMVVITIMEILLLMIVVIIDGLGFRGPFAMPRAKHVHAAGVLSRLEASKYRRKCEPMTADFWRCLLEEHGGKVRLDIP